MKTKEPTLKINNKNVKKKKTTIHKLLKIAIIIFSFLSVLYNLLLYFKIIRINSELPFLILIVLTTINGTLALLCVFFAIFFREKNLGFKKYFKKYILDYLLAILSFAIFFLSGYILLNFSVFYLV